MKDEEFVKLKHWIDSEFIILHVWLALIVGFLADRPLIWFLVVVYVVVSLLSAGARIAYVESKHRGYLDIPKR